MKKRPNLVYIFADDKDGGIASTYQDESKVDFAAPITNGPLDHGFDDYFGVSASLDMPPYVYIENDAATSIPTRQFGGISGKKFMRPGWIGDDFDPQRPLETGNVPGVRWLELPATRYGRGCWFAPDPVV